MPGLLAPLMQPRTSPLAGLDWHRKEKKTGIAKAGACQPPVPPIAATGPPINPILVSGATFYNGYSLCQILLLPYWYRMGERSERVTMVSKSLHVRIGLSELIRLPAECVQAKPALELGL